MAGWTKLKPNGSVTPVFADASDRPANVAWGRVAYADRQSDLVLSSPGIQDIGVSLTFEALPSRLYKVTGQGILGNSTVAQNVEGYVCDSAGTILFRYGEVYVTAGAAFYMQHGSGYLALSGSTTLKLRVLVSTVNVTAHGSATYPHQLLVEDMGSR